jgi:hypothetical protein
MTQTITLTKSQPTSTIECLPQFKKLRANTAVSVEGKLNTDSVPFIELKLQNEKRLITILMNHIAGTNQFLCFDLLEPAASIPSLTQEAFHRLDMNIPEGIFEGDFRVELELEYE